MAVLVASLASLFALLSGVSAAPPNFIFLLVDDVGLGDIDVGDGRADSPAQTPNIREWGQSQHTAVFERFYSGGAVCSPTRSTMLTGRTPTRECIINVEQVSLPSVLNETTTAAYARASGYRTFFGGKWHLGSLTNASKPDCYVNASGVCLDGYVTEAGGLCCDGHDAHVPLATPLDFQFDTALATAQVAPSSTSNCGCVMTVPGAGQNCNLGHYEGSGHSNPGPWLECDQYLSFNATGSGALGATHLTSAAGVMQSVQYVTPVDDAEFLVDNLLLFIDDALAQGKPFLAQVSFHHNHIPYISPPEFRALYANYTLNEQDYYGGLSCVDAQVGRLRTALRARGIADTTWLSLTSDNGPELSVGDHGCSAFPNPGSTAGLLGRKRALTEGGIRLPGVVEFAPLVAQNTRVNGYFPASTMDYLPTVMQLLNATNPLPTWPVDGTSLVDVLAGATLNRSVPIGWMSDFAWQNGTETCGARNNNTPPPSFNASFTTPFNQPQFAWTEGAMKLFACNPPQAAGSWRFSLYDVANDPAERIDLWSTLGSTVGDAMFRRYLVWQASVQNSVTTETKCTIPGRAM